MKIRRLIWAISTAVLAACGGSSTGGGSLPTAGGGPGQPITGRQDLPQTGLVAYSGFMTLNLPDGAVRQAATGDLSLSIDFGAVTDQISGSADGFQMAGEVLTGRIFITDGQIRQATTTEDAGFEADLSGSLRGTSYPNTLITGEVDADFAGSDAAVLNGRVFGDITTTGSIDVFDGTISAARP